LFDLLLRLLRERFDFHCLASTHSRWLLRCGTIHRESATIPIKGIRNHAGRAFSS
jgi:hypothetical protein